MNEAYSKIDSGVKQNSDELEGLTTVVESVESDVTNLDSRVSALENKPVTMSSPFDYRIGGLLSANTNLYPHDLLNTSGLIYCKTQIATDNYINCKEVSKTTQYRVSGGAGIWIPFNADTIVSCGAPIWYSVSIFPEWDGKIMTRESKTIQSQDVVINNPADNMLYLCIAGNTTSSSKFTITGPNGDAIPYAATMNNPVYIFFVEKGQYTIHHEGSYFTIVQSVIFTDA